MDTSPGSDAKHPLAHAMDVQRAASHLGFDWPEISGVLDKVAEELAELRAAVKYSDKEHAQAELGDMLFAAVSVARFLDVSPETCLQDATERFEKRLALVKQIAAEEGLELQSCAADTLDTMWEQAKRLMRQQLEKGLDNAPETEAR